MLNSQETPSTGAAPATTPTPGRTQVARQATNAQHGPRRGKRNARRGTPWADDRVLVDAILAGSQTHFDLLYTAYFDRVFRFAVKRLRDAGEAEDVTQEVFMTVFRALDTWQGNSSLLVWIFGITRNKVNRRFRGIRPRFETIDGEGASEIAASQSPTDRTVDARRMLEHCEYLIEHELTPLQRRIFHLKHLRRQSIRTIANSLGKSEDAIKANLYRMRRSICAAAPGLEVILH